MFFTIRFKTNMTKLIIIFAHVLVENARQSLKHRWRNQFMNADIFGEESESDIFSEDDDEKE